MNDTGVPDPVRHHRAGGRARAVAAERSAPRTESVWVTTTRRLDATCIDQCRGDHMRFRTRVALGVLDDRTRHVYRCGQCHALARATAAALLRSLRTQ